MVKSVETKGMKKGIFKDIIVIVVCYLLGELLWTVLGMPFLMSKLIISLWGMFGVMAKDIANIFVTIVLFLVFVLSSLALILANLVVLSPVIGIYFGIKYAKRKKELDNRTYTSEEDIVYYREALKEVTPTDMSILVNLGIEEKKDVSAVLLDLYNKNLIELVDNKVMVRGEDPGRVNDITLARSLENGTFNEMVVKEWKEKAIDDAVNKNLVVRKYGKNKLISRVVFLIISVILFFMVPNIVNNIFVDNLTLDDPVVAEEVAKMSDKEFVNSKYFLETIIEIGRNATGVLIIAIIFILPIYSLVFIIRYKTLKNKLKRTAYGSELTEKVAAIKRFVHDFTNLNMAEKERIVLWKDFLVYAVVLEENEMIVEDICNSYQVNYTAIKNILR